MRKRISILLIGIYLSLSFHMQGQIEAMFGMYRQNPQILNPAFSGNKEFDEINIQYRNQWLGLPGSPQTIVFTSNINFLEKSGLGINLLKDQIGPVKTIMASIDYAYHAQLTQNTYLSMGLRGGLYDLYADFSELELVNPDDYSFKQSISSGANPNLGMGIRIGNLDGWFIGLSVPRLVDYKMKSFGGFIDSRYVYLLLGNKYDFTLPNHKISIYPSMVFRMATDVPLNSEVNILSSLDEKLDFGLSYRLRDSFGLRAGIKLKERIKLNYQFEFPVSKLSNFNTYTYEIGIKYQFNLSMGSNKKDEKIQSEEN